MDILSSLKSRLNQAKQGFTSLVGNTLKGVGNTNISDLPDTLSKAHDFLMPQAKAGSSLLNAISGGVRGSFELAADPKNKLGPLTGPVGFAKGAYKGYTDPTYSSGEAVSEKAKSIGLGGPIPFLAGLATEVAIPGPGGEKSMLGKVGKEEISSLAPKAFKATLSANEDILKAARGEIGKVTKEKNTVSKWLNKFYTDWVNEWHPIESITTKYEKMLGSEIPTTMNPKYLIKRLLGTGASAEYRHKSVLEPILKEVSDIPAEDFDVFLKAKRDMGFDEAGRTILGSNPDLASKRITALTEKYGSEAVRRMESTANKLYEYQDASLRKLVDTGFIDSATYADIKGKNVNYVPYQRVMDDLDQYMGTGTKAQVGTQPIKEIKGSERQIYSPIESVIADTYKIENLVAKNNVARSIADLRTIIDDGTIVPLRTAENVKKRIDIFSELGTSRIVKDKLERLVSTRNRWVRGIESELNKLNKMGLNEYLKAKPDPALEGVTSSLKTKVKRGVPTTSIITEGPEGREVKAFINQLIAEPPEKIVAIKKKIAVRDKRLAAVLDDLSGLSEELNTIKANRASLMDEAKLLKDAESRGKATLAVWRDGVKELYEIPQDIEAAVKGMNQESMNTLTKIMSAPATLFRQGQTGRNLDFMIPNAVKDQLDAAVNSQYGYRPFIDYISGLMDLVEFNRTGNNKIVQQWLENGGGQYFAKLSGREAVAEQIMDATTKKNLIKKLGEWAVGGIETIGKYSEVPTRIGLYKRALAKTGSIDKAVMESREATVDFARMGAKMRTANSIIPFLNPSVQGFDKMLRVAKTNPKGFIMRLGAFGVLPAATASMYNNIFYPEEYAKIPQWEKSTNFVIMTGKDVEGKPSYIKIPKGNVIPMIANPTDHFISYLYNNDRQSFYAMASSIFSDLFPVISEGTSISDIATRTIGSNIPQAIKPVIETAFNFDSFKGKPIVPYFTSLKEPGKQTFNNTPKAYNKIGETLNISPLKVQHLAEGYLAGYVKMPTNIIATLNSIAKGENVDPNQVVILRRFFGNYEDYNITGGVLTPTKPSSTSRLKTGPKLRKPGPSLK